MIVAPQALIFSWLPDPYVWTKAVGVAPFL